MPGAFMSPWGPFVNPLKPEEERLPDAQRNAAGFAASVADPMSLTTMLGPDSLADPMEAAQDAADPWANISGSLMAPMGFMTSAPKMTAAGIGLGSYLTDTDTAEAGAKKRMADKPVEAEAQAEDQLGALVKKWQDKDPTLGALYSSYQQEKAKANQAVKGVDKASADQVRMRANETAQGIFDQITKRIETLDPPKKTFQQRYGGIAENWDKVQAGTGVAVGAILGAKGAMADDMLKYRPWRNTIKKYDKAMDPSPIAQAMGRKADPVKAREQAERLKGFSDKWGTSGKDKGSIAIPMLAGGVAATELGALPDVYNKRYAPEDSPDFKQAQKNQADPLSMLAAYGPMAAISALGAGTGAKIFGGKDKGQALAARSEPAISRLGPGDRAQRSQNFTKSIEDDAALRAAAQPPAPPPTAPVKPPKAPAPPGTPTKAQENVEAKKAMEQALNQLRSGKKVSLARLKKVPPKRLQKIEKLIRDAQADNPGAPSDVVADILGGQNSRGNLKYGVAGAATGYSAILAERLAKMEEDKAQEF